MTTVMHTLTVAEQCDGMWSDWENETWDMACMDDWSPTIQDGLEEIRSMNEAAGLLPPSCRDNELIHGHDSPCQPPMRPSGDS